MIVLLSTASPVCKLVLVDGGDRFEYEWEADRQLAKGLLGYLKQVLSEHNYEWDSISGIGAYRGPGSFTGLRIGLTVANTLSDGLHVPIVGATGGDWQHQAIVRLESGENDKIVLPDYGAPAHITSPRK